MNEQQKLGALEAMLFANAEPVEAARLAEAMRIDPAQAEELLRTLQAEYDTRESGLMLLQFDGGRWQMATRPYYGEMVKRVLDTRHNAPLSPAALEVPGGHRLQPAGLPQLYRAGSRGGFLLYRQQVAGTGADRGGRGGWTCPKAGGFPGDGYLPAGVLAWAVWRICRRCMKRGNRTRDRRTTGRKRCPGRWRWRKPM